MAAKYARKIISWSIVLIAAGLCTLSFAMRSRPMNIYELLLLGIIWTTLFYMVGYICGEGLTFGRKGIAFFQGIENQLPSAIWSIKTGGWKIIAGILVFAIGIVRRWTDAYYSGEPPVFQSAFLDLCFISLAWMGPTFFLGYMVREVEGEKARKALQKDMAQILPDASIEEQMIWSVAHGDDHKVEHLLKQGVSPSSIWLVLKLIITKEDDLDINNRLCIMWLLLGRLSAREINAKDSEGRTLLMYAAARANCDRFEIGELLLHGADPFIVNVEGESARDIVAMRNNQRVLEVFDEPWALNLVQKDLSAMMASRTRVRVYEEKLEKEKELPLVLERNKRVLSLSVAGGVILALFFSFFA